MNTKALECFLLAAEELNFTRAAERLYMSQQSLSYHIQRLEDEYHVKLFERDPSLHLTLAGENMLFYAKQILQFDSQMKADFADISAFCRGRISFGVARLRNSTIFPAIYSEFHEQWSNVDFTLVEGSSSTFSRMLENHELDLYIGFPSTRRPEYETIRIGTERLVCCMHVDFYKRFKDVIHPNGTPYVSLKDICQFPLCTLPTYSSLRINIDQYFSQHHIKPNIVLETVAQDSILNICQNNQTVGILTNTAYFHFSNSNLNNNLVAFPLEESISTFPFYLVYGKNTPHPQYFQDFVSITARHFQNYSDSMENYLYQLKNVID